MDPTDPVELIPELILIDPESPNDVEPLLISIDPDDPNLSDDFIDIIPDPCTIVFPSTVTSVEADDPEAMNTDPPC